MNLSVELTQAQYDRFKTAMQAMVGEEVTITDENLVAQMKREASAITYGYESQQAGFDANTWSF